MFGHFYLLQMRIFRAMDSSIRLSAPYIVPGGASDSTPIDVESVWDIQVWPLGSLQENQTIGCRGF